MNDLFLSSSFTNTKSMPITLQHNAASTYNNPSSTKIPLARRMFRLDASLTNLPSSLIRGIKPE